MGLICVSLICFFFRPGVGKTTVMREIARVLADELHRRVVCLKLLCLFMVSILDDAVLVHQCLMISIGDCGHQQ